MRYINKIVFLIFSVMMFIGCTRRVVNRAELIDFLIDESNGLVKKQVFSDIEYTALLWPKELVVDHELDALPKETKPDSILKEFRNCLFFRLQLSQDSNDVLLPSNPYHDFYLHIISTELKTRVFLTGQNSKKHIPLSSFVLPRTFGSTTYTSLMLCFNDSDLEKIGEANYDLSISDFTTNKTLTFSFKSKDFRKIPILNLNKK